MLYLLEYVQNICTSLTDLMSKSLHIRYNRNSTVWHATCSNALKGIQDVSCDRSILGCGARIFISNAFTFLTYTLFLCLLDISYIYSFTILLCWDASSIRKKIYIIDCNITLQFFVFSFFLMFYHSFHRSKIL